MDAQMQSHRVPEATGRFGLFSEIGVLHASRQYRTTGHAAHTLVKRPELAVVLVVLERGAVLPEHHVKQPVSIQTLTGSVEVRARSRAVVHGAGGLQILDPDVVHRVKALKDCALLLTIPWPAREPVAAERREHAAVDASDRVDEAGAESFPASDPPGWTLGPSRRPRD